MHRDLLRRQLLSLALVLWWSMTWAAAAAPWFMRVWQVDDGLPGDNVTGVAQSEDGYLWIATQSGLARFDGITIKEVNLPVGRAHPIIRALTLARNGNLWLALDGGTVVRYDRVNARQFGGADGLPRLPLVDAFEGADGAIWISYLDGSVSRILGDEVKRFGGENGLTGSGTCSLAAGASGELWFAKGGQIGRYGGERFAVQFTVPERYVQILAARAGGMWICAGNRLLKYGADSNLVEVAKIPVDAAVVRPTALLEDQEGGVWIGTAATGLFRYGGAVIEPMETSHGRIRTIAQDREGNIWVGTDGGGLNRLRQQVVEVQGRADGLPFDTVRSVGEDRAGTLWVVTQNGDVANNWGGTWQTVGAADGWPGGQATCVACDPSGVVWFGTYSHGLYYLKDGRFSVVRRRDGLLGTSVRCLLADQAGNLWITFSGDAVLQRWHAGKFQNFALREGSKAVRALLEGGAGQIWLANMDAELLRVEGDQVVVVTPLAGESPRPIRSLAWTADGSLWIGYSSAGVGRLKAGKFSLIGEAQGLLDNSICSLMADRRGWFWFGSDHGIFRVSQTELHEVAEGQAEALNAESYGKDDGLPSLQGYYGHSPGAALTRDGRVLIPTHSGLAIVHPDRVHTNRVAPPVLIESVLVDNRELLAAGPARKLVLPPDYKKLDIHFTAPSFIEPEKVRFSFQVRGWDEEWTESSDERSASFSRLPAGAYVFRVKAGNNTGVWNEAGAELSFQVLPFFWQTWWFRLAAVGILLVLTYAAVRFIALRRLRKKMRWLEAENALQRERARIARDIHDDLGAHMTQISLLAELTEQAIGKPEQAGDHVRQIATMSRRGIKALDEIVWAVNPRNDTVADLLDYAGQYAVNFLNAAGLRCRLEFPAEPVTSALSAEVRHGLFLALKEALHNAAKHSRASEVRLTVRLTAAEMVWLVVDNGCGFAQAPGDALADGLRNMQQRLVELGGSCTITSKLGAGVTIQFTVPCRENES